MLNFCLLFQKWKICAFQQRASTTNEIALIELFCIWDKGTFDAEALISQLQSNIEVPATQCRNQEAFIVLKALGNQAQDVVWQAEGRVVAFGTVYDRFTLIHLMVLL